MMRHTVCHLFSTVSSSSVPHKYKVKRTHEAQSLGKASNICKAHQASLIISWSPSAMCLSRCVWAWIPECSPWQSHSAGLLRCPGTGHPSAEGVQLSMSCQTVLPFGALCFSSACFVFMFSLLQSSHGFILCLSWAPHYCSAAVWSSAVGLISICSLQVNTSSL